MAEWWYNTNFHTSINPIHFEALYGYKPPQLGIPHEPKTTEWEWEVNQFLEERFTAAQRNAPQCSKKNEIL